MLTKKQLLIVETLVERIKHLRPLFNPVGIYLFKSLSGEVMVQVLRSGTPKCNKYLSEKWKYALYFAPSFQTRVDYQNQDFISIENWSKEDPNCKCTQCDLVDFDVTTIDLIKLKESNFKFKSNSTIFLPIRDDYYMSSSL